MYVCFHLSIVYITLYINAHFEFVQKKQTENIWNISGNTRSSNNNEFIIVDFYTCFVWQQPLV